MRSPFFSVPLNLVLIVCCFFLAARQTSASFVVNTNSGGTNLVSIDSLQIGSTVYKVTFMRGTYDSVFASMSPEFFMTGQAAAAADAIRDALNEYRNTAITEITTVKNVSGLNGEFNLGVPDTEAALGGIVTQRVLKEPGEQYRRFTSEFSPSTNFDSIGLAWAKFTVVPEPSAWLVWAILGACGMGFLRLRRRC